MASGHEESRVHALRAESRIRLRDDVERVGRFWYEAKVAPTLSSGPDPPPLGNELRQVRARLDLDVPAARAT